MTGFETLTYETQRRIAVVTLNRPDRLNAIDDAMPGEIRAAVERANADDDVRVHRADRAPAAPSAPATTSSSSPRAPDRTRASDRAVGPDGRLPRDEAQHRRLLRALALLKPTICKVRGYAIAGGSDIALSCDLLVMAEDAKIGYPPARVWGCPTTAMWVYRLGAQRAKRMLLTGDLIDGATAAEWGLALEAVPEAELDARVDELARADRRRADATSSSMQKLMVNQAYENMGLAGTQVIATLFDGIARHSAEGRWFEQLARDEGFHAAVEWRDSGREIPDGGAT